MKIGSKVLIKNTSGVYIVEIDHISPHGIHGKYTTISNGKVVGISEIQGLFLFKNCKLIMFLKNKGEIYA